MALTEKQQRFVEEYLVDLNATQAAIRAGYSAKTAGNIGYEQLGRSDVAEAIAAAQAARAARTQVTADTVLQHLDVARRADLADLYDDAGNLKPIREWPLIWRQGLVAGVEVEELFEGRGEDREQIGRLRKVKLADRVRITELIGKHVGVGAFRDRLEHTGPNGGPIETVTRIELVAPKQDGAE